MANDDKRKRKPTIHIDEIVAKAEERERELGMSYSRYEEISNAAAKGEPLELSEEEEARYKRADDKIRESAKGLRDQALKQLQPSLDSIQKILGQGSREALKPIIDSVTEQQHKVDRLPRSVAPSFRGPDLEFQRQLDDIAESKRQLQEEERELQRRQTEALVALNDHAADEKQAMEDSARRQMWWNVVITVVAVLTLVATIIGLF